MKPNLILAAVTLLNAGMLAASLLQSHPASAATDDGILRGRGLQIVDEHGKVRASIQILPAAPQNDGTTSPETVLLRLITEQGRPAVKIATSERQSGMALTGPTGTSNTYIQAIAGGATSTLLVRNEDGSEEKIAP